MIGSDPRPSTIGLLEMLAAWLPRQRWFPGGGRPVSDLTVISDVTLASGDPALRHLIIQTPLHGDLARFQVLIGSRAELPATLHGALIGRDRDRTYYDALHDPELADLLLQGIDSQWRVDSLRFVREPAAGPHTRPGDWPAARLLTAEQSNTSLIFGDVAILKVLRRLFTGANPDLEVADALARLGSARVAAPYGWIETKLDGQQLLLAVLSQFIAGAQDGWSLALADLARLYSLDDNQERQDQATPTGQPGRLALPFIQEARLLGEATAELHTDMAAAFGSRQMTSAELADLTCAMNAKLTDAVAAVPELRRHQDRIRSAYAEAAQLSVPLTIQRIHGDYHLGQVLRGGHGWVALDFEGEPGVPLEQRRAMSPALRDVAGMLRSFDYAARHCLIRHPEAERLAPLAAAWVEQCQAAFRAGYLTAGGADPDGNAALLRALTLEKAVYEVIYEVRHRPNWLSIPMDFVAAA